MLHPSLTFTIDNVCCILGFALSMRRLLRDNSKPFLRGIRDT